MSYLHVYYHLFTCSTIGENRVDCSSELLETLLPQTLLYKSSGEYMQISCWANTLLRSGIVETLHMVCSVKCAYSFLKWSFQSTLKCKLLHRDFGKHPNSSSTQVLPQNKQDIASGVRPKNRY
jgi:hypothetical protein